MRLGSLSYLRWLVPQSDIANSQSSSHQKETILPNIDLQREGKPEARCPSCLRTFDYHAGGCEGRHHRMLIRASLQVGIKTVGTLFSGSGDNDGRSIALPVRVAEKVLSEESALSIKGLVEKSTDTLLERSKGRVRMIDQLIEIVFE